MRTHCSSEVVYNNIDDEETTLMNECPYVISFLTEFFATAIQMFVGCLGSIETFNIGPFITTFSFGLGRLACFEIFNHISPVHVNPAKSFGFVILGRMSLVRFVIYATAQFLGATAGVAFVMVVMPSNIESVCVVHVHLVTPYQALIMELFNTMILMLAVARASDPIHEQDKNTLNLRVALVVTVLVLAMDTYTGAGKNPARSLSPSLLFNHWDDHWLYHVGPYCGAVLGALLYRFIFDIRCRQSLHYKLGKARRISRARRTNRREDL